MYKSAVGVKIPTGVQELTGANMFPTGVQERSPGTQSGRWAFSDLAINRTRFQAAPIEFQAGAEERDHNDL